MTEFIKKPWGSEELLEKNEHYVVKRLFMKKNHQCSLQYHALKHETVYVLSGILKVLYGDEETSLEQIILESGDSLVIPPLKIHRMFGISDSYYLESSTTELDDVVRLQDDYKRNI